jgi:site-specific DNA recombinase
MTQKHCAIRPHVPAGLGFRQREMHHGSKWFKGEHEAIVDGETFDRVQLLLKGNATCRKVKRSESGALLIGKLYDDRDNLMSPSFSTKNGVRYRFCVSSALLRGRKDKAGSIGRLAALAKSRALSRKQFGGS